MGDTERRLSVYVGRTSLWCYCSVRISIKSKNAVSFIWLRFFCRAAQALFTEKTQNYAIFFTNRVYFILWNKEKLSITES